MWERHIKILKPGLKNICKSLKNNNNYYFANHLKVLRVENRNKNGKFRSPGSITRYKKILPKLG